MATAAICQVAYNYSNDPKTAFRAEITFRKHLDVKHELNKFFGDIKLREQLLNGRGEFEDDDDQEGPDSSDLGEVIARINATAEKIGAVWGHTLTELEVMSTQDLLTKNDPAVKLLNTTKRINAADLSTFAPEVKPYLDATTTTSITGRAGAKTRDMAVWPLIDHVKVYVKSDILRGGIVLVDLPGLGEIVESRAAVARQFYNKLTVSIVVTPSVRAAGEKTAVNLMTENQEINMRMSGKLDDRGYCVVLSKADDGVDWETTARNQNRQKDIKMVSDLNKKIKEGGTAAKKFNLQITKLLQSLKSRKISEEERTKVFNQLREEREKKRKYMKLQRELKRQKKEAHWGQVFTAAQSRSAILAKEINRYLNERHAVFMKSCPGAKTPYCPPKIFPVSVRAYWPLQKKNEDDPDAMPEDPLVGFPEEAYTGIPALKRWLYEATVPPRERHMKALLNRVVGLYYNLQTWSDKECEKIKLHMTPEELQEEYLDVEYERLDLVSHRFPFSLQPYPHNRHHDWTC